MFKLFHPKKEQSKTIKREENGNHTEKENKSETKKKTYPGREDGGPSTRSKTAQENLKIKISYADILKAPAPKIIKRAQVKSINAHKIKEFINAQQQQTASINEINTRKAAAKRTKVDIQKLNLQQWTTLKESVKSETAKWKNSLVRNDWCNIGLIGSWTNLAYQGK